VLDCPGKPGNPVADVVSRAGTLATSAPAKINLTLRVIGRRADGYHDLESLVAFAPFGDTLRLRIGAPLAIAVSGPTAAGAGPDTDNLVLRAAQAIAARVDGIRLGRFALTKRLPAGAGLGGGSADAAAALRLIAQANGLKLDDRRLFEAARATGADVPVCLDPQPRLMRGTGDILSAPLVLPRLGILIAHPGVGVPTAKVFAALGLAPGEPSKALPSAATDGAAAPDRETFLAALGGQANDLETAAVAIAPVIGDVLRGIAALPGCRLSRMSGSGSACFGLFASARAAAAAAGQLRLAYPAWWVRAGRVGALPISASMGALD
jgi:4-diphosphocytidyl-2-C-methyl-D-erythritol kinase